MQYEYECQKCGHDQVVVHKLAETNKQHCEKCDAPPEELKRDLLTAHPTHVSRGTVDVR